MPTVKILSGAVVDYTDDGGWSEFVKWLDGTYAHLPYEHEFNGDAYLVHAFDQGVTYTCGVNTADATDYINNYRDAVRRPVMHRTDDTDILATNARSLPVGADPKIQSYQLSVPAETLGILDVWIGGDFVGAKNESYVSGGRYTFASSAVLGTAVHLAAVDRDDILGYFSTFGLSRSKVENLTSISGTFQVGETITGGTSGAKTTVLAVGSDYLEVRHFVDDGSGHIGTFTASETITGGTSGATATLHSTPFTEGDAFQPEPKIIEDDFVYGYAERNFSAEIDGCMPLPPGIYLRVMMYNADPSNAAVIIPSFVMGRR